VRAIVADHQVSWTASWAEYTPVEYTAEKVLANDATVNPSGWADPPDPSVLEPHAWAERGSHESPLLFNAKRFPMNPRGRSGMGGRGLLGKWGPNFAADPIVTRWHASLGAPPRLQVVVIERRDTGEWALPGGMVDAAETVSAAVRREFEEEAGNLEDVVAQATFRRLTDELFSSGVVVYEGYVDNPRNTDHAWMETTAVHLHCSDALGGALPLNAGDDAKAVQWVDVGGPEHATMYADRKDWVDCAEARLLKLRGGAGSPFRAPKLPAAVTRGTVHVTLAAVLCAPLGPSMALFVPRAVAAQIQSPTVQVKSLLDAGATRSDPLLKAAVQSLLDEAAPAAAVDFAQSQGTWRVVSAPLFDTISRIALTNLEVTYRIGAGGTIGATVRYESRLVGSGWLCTDGTIKNVEGALIPTVSLVWERIWWQPGGQANAPPTDPEVEGAAALRPLVQTLGRLGFSPELAVFPVRYVDSDAGIAVFKFQDLTVAVRRTS
jgi:ADP-ribose pyrophosphatase